MLFKVQIFAIFWGMYGCQHIARIEECGLTCSQGFVCKSQKSVSILNSFCNQAPVSLSPTTLRTMKVWTAMKCTEQNQCSLYLSIKGTLQLDDNVSGVELCSLSMATQASRCVEVKISKSRQAKLTGRKVKVQFDCFEVGAGQKLYVTMRTIPNYCGIQKNQVYLVEDCRNSDVGNNIPVCFAARMTYSLDKARKNVLVNISDVVQGRDYYARLCHQWFVCKDAGPVTLIQGKDLGKPISLQYHQLLPCLCIEAWPAIADARRAQVCPFKNNTKALWENIIYNPFTHTLSWEAACPVHVTVSLCQLMKIDNQCVDLENSSLIAPEKVKYPRVDAHPRLCMKFTTKHNIWIRCPFSQRKSGAWKMRLSLVDEHIEVSFLSRTAEAQFSVLVCNRTEGSSCNSTSGHQPASVSGLSSKSVNISGKACDSNICIWGWRTDMDYSIPSYVCDLPCTSSSLSQSHNKNSLSILSLVIFLSMSIILMAFLGKKLLSAFHKKRLNEKSTMHIKILRMKNNSSLH